MGTKVILGKTNLEVEKNGFGALPIQRISKKDAVYLLQKAYDAGMNFFDTARAYTDSEEKMGEAFKGKRDKIIIASKSMAGTGDAMKKDLETSLKNLGTDYIDIYQFHTPPFCPKPGGEDGLYDAALEAKAAGKIRFISITNHRPAVAIEAIESDLYDTLQFPFCYLAADIDYKIQKLTEEHNMGFIGMKSLSGGLITNSKAAAAFANQFKNLVPIWGIQRESELDEFISYISNPPTMDEEITAFIDKEKLELSGDFCRACGYCMPCPVGIEINTCARMSQLIRRLPSEPYLTEESKAKMMKAKECVNCGKCKSKCPYGLNTPELLKKNLADYENILAGKVAY